MSKDQRSGFEDRLSRIKKGGSNTMGEIQVGPREEIRAGSKSKPSNTVRMKKKSGVKKEIGRSSGLTLVILAFIFGALSMFVGQVAGFHFFQEGGLAPIDLTGSPVEEYLPFAHLIIGGVLALLFCWTFQLTTVMRLLAAVIGLGVMVQFHTDLVQQVPGIFIAFFSEDYVKTVVQNIPAAPTPTA